MFCHLTVERRAALRATLLLVTHMIWGVKFHRVLVVLFSLPEDISDFIYPAELQHYLRVGQRQSGGKPITTAYNYPNITW